MGSVILGAFIFLFSSKFTRFTSFFQTGNTVGIVDKFNLDNLPLVIQQEISVGLTRLDANNQPIPGIATSWENQESGRVWIFHLGNYKWQDGTEIQARDINYQFKDAKKELIDSKTIKFTLNKDPYIPFPTAVTKPIFKKGLVGAGDWKVTNLTTFTGQFSRSLTLVNKKRDEKKTYRFYDTEEIALTAYKLGQVRSLVGIIDPKDLITWNNAKIDIKTNEDRYVGIFLNMQDKVTSDKNIRQALAYAINKDEFPEKRALSVISPKSWVFNPQVKDYKYNPDRAKELLKNVPVEIKKGININLVTLPSLLPVADKIKKSWEDIGLHTNIQVVNAPPEEFQALLWIQSIPSDPDQYSFWHSTQTGTNMTKYGAPAKESPRIDKLLEDGRRTLDPEARKSIYYDFQRFLLEDLPVIPLFYPVTYTITRK
ncbi:MAG: ABC transporter substrate-binding protein [Candidatus Blackburnbacteria bacterium]|nr:ABC transporter substrate-binding protein [Candidatus Blackburnbacteria bacterium]